MWILYRDAKASDRATKNGVKQKSKQRAVGYSFRECNGCCAEVSGAYVEWTVEDEVFPDA
jgi:hypothetical protein